MKLVVETKINASATKAWEVVGEGFADIASWSCGLAQSSLDGELKSGAIRTCVSAASFGPFEAGTVQEQLTEFDSGRKTFSYQAISGLPGFISKAQNQWSVLSRSDKSCVIRFDAEIQFRGFFRPFGIILAPIMKLMMKSDLAKMQEEMIFRIENGKPHPRKLSHAS